jgi:hypothetical protein
MRKFLKRAALALLILFVLVQLPFVYRRYQMGKTAEQIARADTQRTQLTDDRFIEYKGVIHVHTSLGGHSTGTFDELIAAANANDLDFVLMTEHYTDAYDTSALTLNGVYGKTLFVGGNEIDTADGDRFLMIPGSSDAAGMRHLSTTAVIEKLRAENRLALVTYPERFKSWDTEFDGIEVFSLHTSAKSMNPFTALFDVIWSFPAYPALTLARYFRRPDENLRRFDEIAAGRNVTLFAGADAHSNLGFHLFGDDAGNRLINIKLDRYETVFRIVRLHVLIEKIGPFDREALVEALKNGRFYVGLDAIGDPTGFRYQAGTESLPGQEGDAAFGGPSNLSASVTLNEPVRFVIYGNGLPVYDSKEEYDNDVQFTVTEPGAYRVEAYRSGLDAPFDTIPWIISNPIYVR